MLVFIHSAYKIPLFMVKLYLDQQGIKYTDSKTRHSRALIVYTEDVSIYFNLSKYIQIPYFFKVSDNSVCKVCFKGNAAFNYYTILDIFYLKIKNRRPAQHDYFELNNKYYTFSPYLSTSFLEGIYIFTISFLSLILLDK